MDSAQPSGSLGSSEDGGPSTPGRSDDAIVTLASKRRLSPLDITLHELLGSGSYGMVYKATAAGDLNCTVAVKVLPWGPHEVSSELKRELKLLQRCNSPAIVRAYSAFAKPKELWLVMEYCDLGSLLGVPPSGTRPASAPAAGGCFRVSELSRVVGSSPRRRDAQRGRADGRGGRGDRVPRRAQGAAAPARAAQGDHSPRHQVRQPAPQLRGRRPRQARGLWRRSAGERGCAAPWTGARCEGWGSAQDYAWACARACAQAYAWAYAHAEGWGCAQGHDQAEGWGLCSGLGG
eukprot:7132672-Prymnesium_polylepis.2